MGPCVAPSSPLRLEVRDRDGGPSDDDGALFVVSGTFAADLGLWLMVGHDLHPATLRSFEVELLEGAWGLFVHATQRGIPCFDRWLASDDGGRTWRELEHSARSPEGARLLDRIYRDPWLPDPQVAFPATEGSAGSGPLRLMPRPSLALVALAGGTIEARRGPRSSARSSLGGRVIR